VTDSARIPTSPNAKEGWSIETAIDHVLALESAHREGSDRLLAAKIEALNSKIEYLTTLISANDRRYEQRFEGQKAAIDAAFSAQKEAITKAENSTERRFENMNEFRGALDNQQRTLIPRSEVVVMVHGLEEKIANNTKQMDAFLAERQGIKGGWGYAAGLIGVVLTLASLGLLIVKALRP
jgi:hypothetical protein